MRRTGRSGRRGRLGRMVGGLMLIAGLFGLWGIREHLSDASRYWPGWYAVRFPKDMEAAALGELLESMGISGSLSAASARVLVQEIPRTAEIPADRIGERLQEGDPRLDPFLRNVSKLFESGDSSVIYLQADRSPGAYRRAFRRRRELSNVEIMDDDSPGNWKSALVFLACAAVIWVLTSEGALDCAPAALPWFVLVGLGGWELLFPALAAYVTAALRHARGGWAPPCFFAAAVIMGVLVFYASAAAAGMFALAFIISEFAPVSVGGAAGGRGSGGGEGALGASTPPRRRAGRREHNLFEPLSLSSRAGREARPSIAGIRVWRLIILGLIPASAVFYPEPARHDPIPALGRVVGSLDSMAALHRLAEFRGADSLPDIGDMVSSAVYQRGFMDGARYEVPRPGTSLIRREYSEDDAGLGVKDRAVTLYDAQWFRETMNSVLSRGPGRLYAAAGGIGTAAAVRRPGSRMLRVSIDSTAALLIAAAMLAALLPRRWALRARGNDSLSSRRLRKIQAA